MKIPMSILRKLALQKYLYLDTLLGFPISDFYLDKDKNNRTFLLSR